jgi:hypothetical protein
MIPVTTRQKGLACTLLFILLTLTPLISFAKTPQAPLSIAGITLGTDVNSYPEIIDTNYLKEVVVTNWHGFRKGIISYGICQYQDQILKMDMKYEDNSEAFFKTLLKKYRQTFGEPHSWHGDAFGVMQIWKWQFVDGEQNPVSLTLQYNSKDSRETMGNMVKLAYPMKIEEERLCFVEMCAVKMTEVESGRQEELQRTGWEYLIPR